MKNLEIKIRIMESSREENVGKKEARETTQPEKGM